MRAAARILICLRRMCHWADEAAGQMKRRCASRLQGKDLVVVARHFGQRQAGEVSVTSPSGVSRTWTLSPGDPRMDAPA